MFLYLPSKPNLDPRNSNLNYKMDPAVVAELRLSIVLIISSIQFFRLSLVFLGNVQLELGWMDRWYRNTIAPRLLSDAGTFPIDIFPTQ